MTSDLSNACRVARRITLTGGVQGLGVRPAIHRLAAACELAGSVANSSRGVEIEVEGLPEQLARFVAQLSAMLPEAQLEERLVEEIPATGRRRFAIIPTTADGPLAARVPLDARHCDNCLAETRDPHDRRFGWPFTSCTVCGPRYSIIRSLPYDRRDTSMNDFQLCPLCREEFDSPADRRFHAQTNGCGRCGPQVWAVDKLGRACGRRQDAVTVAVNGLRQGKIVALRGVGGYQLLVDACDADAVLRLRDRKRRPSKPFAVLVSTWEYTATLAQVNDAERQALTSRANPIVLLEARQSSLAADAIHPGLNTIGIMLPTTPLHATIAERVGRPLVCTSANREGDPLEYEPENAVARLSDIADLFLHHDRAIVRPIDDSVVRIIAGRPVTMRLGRGLAPHALSLPHQHPALATGGHQKAAAAWSNGTQAVLGPHIGDLEGLATRERFLRSHAGHLDLYRFEPQMIAHDSHPGYFTTAWAEGQGSPLVGVQHHHAHVVAGMIEAGWLDRTVLGVAWDGTGLGDDGTIWGGEFLIANSRRYERFATLRPFRLPGGEAAIREPWRTAVALLHSALSEDALSEKYVDEEDAVAAHAGIGKNRAIGKHEAGMISRLLEGRRSRAVVGMLGHPALSPVTTSAGRLFDGAAAIALGLDSVDFDGQAAMLWEAVADRAEPGSYPLPVRTGLTLELDWRPLIRALANDVVAGVDLGAISMRFHRATASAIVDVSRRRPDLPVVFSGGVFQNRVLTELLRDFADELSQPVGFPGLIPPNDGGLAAGQLAAALCRRAETAGVR